MKLRRRFFSICEHLKVRLLVHEMGIINPRKAGPNKHMERTSLRRREWKIKMIVLTILLVKYLDV